MAAGNVESQHVNALLNKAEKEVRAIRSTGKIQPGVGAIDVQWVNEVPLALRSNERVAEMIRLVQGDKVSVWEEGLARALAPILREICASTSSSAGSSATKQNIERLVARYLVFIVLFHSTY